MTRKKRPQTRLIHHYDFPRYLLTLTHRSLVANQSQTMNVKEGDDYDSLLTMANELVRIVPSNVEVTLSKYENDEVVMQEYGMAEPSKPRNHTYEIVEVDDDPPQG